jgi:hypothetical protein
MSRSIIYTYPGSSRKGIFGEVFHFPNDNTNRQSDLFHYSLEGPNFTYGKQMLNISEYSV